MPRRMSVSKTMAQVRARTKDVTRRLGWAWLVEAHAEAMRKTGRGVRLTMIEKGMGLRNGEHQIVVAEVETVAVTRERLDEIFAYGPAEVCREGFPDMSCAGFVAFFTREMRCAETDLVTRIEFRYLDGEP